jgi:LCP family protein required for cell wall assembly
LARKKHARPEGNEQLPLSRNVAGEYYSGKMTSRKRKRIAYTVLATILAVLLGTGVAAAAFVSNINQKLTGRVDANLKTVLTAQEAGKPFYMLLIGVDRNEGRAKKYGAQDSAYRSDTIILTRVDPENKKVTLISIHRDTLVDLGENGQQKINAAYAIGQETYATQVISEFAGVPISHYAEVDMDGLAAVVDCIGGIDIELDYDVIDTQYTHLELKKGKHHLDGATAVKFCRCRHAYDALGDGDRYRAANQRLVISTVAHDVLASDPATIASTVSTMAGYVRTDMDVQTIVSLAMQFIGMDTSKDFYMGMEPTTAKYINNTWYELCDTTAWRKMMRRVDQGLPPTEEGDVDPLESSPDTFTGIEDDFSTGTETYYEDTSEDYYEDTSYYDDSYYYDDSSSYDETYYEEQSYDDGSYSEDTSDVTSQSVDESAAYSEPVEVTYEEPVVDNSAAFVGEEVTDAGV